MNLFRSLAVSAIIIVIARVTAAQIAFAGRPRRVTGRDRGDVPGWVLITLMTAGLVTILWKLAGDQLAALFTQAMGSVTGP
ncbi:MAG: hypothetical protein ABI978_07510 [Chloroflexota bacterium]